MTDPTDAQAERLGGYIPPSPAVENAEELLTTLRTALTNLGRDSRRDSPAFKSLMAMFKEVGGDLHQVKKRVDATRPPPIKKAATIMGRTPGSLLGNIRGAAPPGPVRGATPPASVNGAVPVRAPQAAGPQPSLPAPAEQPAASSGASQPDTASAEAAAPAPLALPKFIESLGPSGRPGVITMGEEVGHLQQVLTHLGYRVADTEIFDNVTSMAIRAFRKDHGLEPGDVVGADMRELLNQVVTGELPDD